MEATAEFYVYNGEGVKRRKALEWVCYQFYYNICSIYKGGALAINLIYCMHTRFKGVGAKSPPGAFMASLPFSMILFTSIQHEAFTCRCSPSQSA